MKELTYCLDCKKKISKSVRTCPHCGSTQPTKKNSRKSDNGFNFWGFNSFFNLSMVMVLKKL